MNGGSDVAGAAYGLRIKGFQDPAMGGRGLQTWPLLTITQEIGDFDPLPHHIDEERATVGSTIVIDRHRQEAVIRAPAPVPTDQLVHPTLAWVGAVSAHWRGLLAMHGGAFTHRGGAWMVLARKGGGKSSTLATLFAAGHEILTDDLIVIDRGNVMSGPRCIDLKEEPESVLGRPIGHLRLGERRRLILPEAPPTTPLMGAFILEWGDRTEVEAVPVAGRIAGVLDHRTLDETDPRLLLALAAVPMWVVRRPRDTGRLPEVATTLVGVADTGPIGSS